MRISDWSSDVCSSDLRSKSREICYSSFAALHSGVSRTALWSAEFLSKDRIGSARKIERTSEFFAETQIPVSESAELDDYRRSGYDRGHLAPSVNMPNKESQAESLDRKSTRLNFSH